MISFANPFYLLLMPLAAGPLILHLLSLRKMRRVEFSSLFFLRKLRERRFRWLRLRDLLLLILRTLFIASLVLALAGPIWRGRFPLARVKADVALILDDSYSTSARFHDLKATALRLVDELSAGSNVALLSPSGSLWDTVWGEPEFAAERIQALASSRSGRDLQASLVQALKLLDKSRASTRRVVMISDGQERALGFLENERIPSDVEMFCFIDEASFPANTSILDVELYPGFPLPGEERFLRIRLGRSGKKVERTLSLWVDERMVEERRTAIHEGRKEIEFRLPQVAQEVRVALDPDSIPADDQRFVLASGSRGLRVAFVGDAGSEFLELALKVGSGVEVQRVSPGGAASLSPLSYDLLIWDGAGGLPAQAAAAASQGLPVLLLLAGDVEDVDGVFEFLGASQDGFEMPAPSALFADLKEEDRRQMKIARHARLKPAGGKVIVSLSGGDPLMLADTSQPVYYLTTRLTPQHTDLVYRALFPVVLQRMVAYVAGGSSQPERFIGDTLCVRVRSGDALFVETPQLHYEITPRRADRGYVVEFSRTADAGFYRIGSETFVVNPDPAEASSVKINTARLQKQGIKVYPLGASTPRKLWLFALILAAACLAAESILILSHVFASRSRK
ncbi:MAG: VWA domain-containing protein [candidate division WOR-3 bacterium]|nr:VWA domain-containing protein [candidate division WOR-3 bacterium]